MHLRVLEMRPGLCDGVDAIIDRAFEEPPTAPKRTCKRDGTKVPCSP